METLQLPPRIYPPPFFSHDSYSSVTPNHQGVPSPRASRFTGEAPHATGPDRVHRSFAPSGDMASRYHMVYTYAPLRGAERSRQEYTDGVVYREQTTGIQKSVTRRYQLPPIRPPRESLAVDSGTTSSATTSTPRSIMSLATDSETTPIATTPQSSTSTLHSSASTVIATHTGH